MDIQKQAFEMQIAFEKHCAISCGISYEYLKAQLDNTESIFGKRYMETSPRHEKWLVWSEAWQQAQKMAVPEGFILINKESLAFHARSIRMFNSGEHYKEEIEEHVCSIEAIIE